MSARACRWRSRPSAGPISPPSTARADPRCCERSLRDAAAHGYCVSVREWHPDIGAVATAIQAPDGAILALNCGGPVFRFDDQYLRRRVAPHLLEAARAIAEEIGGKAMSPADSRRLAATVS